MNLSAARLILSFSTPVVFLLLLCLVTGMPLQARASSGWMQIGTSSLDYGAIATSETGQDVVYADYNGDVWLSQDYGETFTDTLTESGNEWNSLAMSSDGQTIVAQQAGGGYIWYTKNGGLAWSESNATSTDWIALAMTSDGDHIAAITDSSSTPVQISNDGGDTWADAGSLPNQTWAGIAYSADGSQLVVTSNDDGSGTIDISNDYGADWHTSSDPSSDPLGLVAAGDGGKILLASDNDIYESHNGGTSWALSDADGSPYGWSSLGFSYDGQTGFASPWSGSLALSTNGGVNWLAQDDPGVDGWNRSAISGDGTHLYAAAGGTGIWRYGAGADVTAPVITIVGSNPASITVGATYTDAGATASDDIDGDVTGSIVATSNVNTAVAGSYTVTYVANDSSGNYATSTRAVTVIRPNTAASGSSGGTSIAQQVKNLTTMGKTTAAHSLESLWPTLFTASTSATVSAATTPPQFVRDLTLGSVGADVRSLQIFLNAHGFAIAAIGSGSSGNETTHFGALTKAALARYQKANGIVPAAGYFGTKTRAQMKAAGLNGLWW